MQEVNGERKMTEDEPISNGCHDRLMSEVSTEDIKP